MKKCTLLILLILVTTLVYPGSKENMNSFMGFKWGVSASKFLETCSFKDRLEEVENGFMLKGETFGDAFVTVHFVFRDPNNDLFFFEENFPQFELFGVLLEFEPKYFTELVALLKIRYGAPDKERYKRLVEWRNPAQNRKIAIIKKGRKGKGRAGFMAIDKQISKGKEKAASKF